MQNLAPDLPEMCWDVPTPNNYFHGLQMHNLTMADNILFFHRQNRSFLNLRNFESRPHHRFVLIFCYKTPGGVNVDGDTYHLFPGQAFLIAPLQFHFYLDIPEESISWLYMTFVSEQQELLAPLKNLPIRLDREDWRILNTILSQYAKLTEASYWLHSDEIETNSWILQCNRLVQRLLAHAKAKVTPSMNNGMQTPDKMIQKINQFMDHDIYKESDLGSLAKSLHMSPSHLRRRFKKQTGISLGSYQIHFRMNRAIKYLVNTDTSLTEIAVISGYNSLAAFSRSFKQRFGMTPSDYRKSNIERES